MSGYRNVFGGVVFDDVPAPSAAPGGAEFLEDFLNSEGGGGELFEDMLIDSSCGVMEDLQGYPTYPFLELGNSSMKFNASSPGTPVQPPPSCLELGNPSIDLNAPIPGTPMHPPSSFLEPGNSSINLNASTPGTPVQPPPPIASISNPCSPPNSSTIPEEEKPKPYAYVEVVEPSALELQDMTRREWVAEVASMLPHDILKKAPRKRGEGKYFSSGQKYKPCSWEKYIERVNEKIDAGKYKVVANRPRRQRQLRDPEETTDPVIVALQAQAEIYGEHFNGAATFIEWD